MGNGFSTTPVSRITLFCRDLDQSLELYRDILCFKEIENKTIQSKEFNELMNIEDENCFVRISYLQSEESEHGLIALFEINSNNLDTYTFLNHQLIFNVYLCFSNTILS